MISALPVNYMLITGILRIIFFIKIGVEEVLKNILTGKVWQHDKVRLT